MIFVAVLALTFLLAVTLVAGAALALSEPNRRLRFTFVGLSVAGCAAAVWCAFYVEYQPNPTLRIRGVPLPSQALQLENGRWVPFEGSGWIINLVVVPSATYFRLARCNRFQHGGSSTSSLFPRRLRCPCRSL